MNIFPPQKLSIKIIIFLLIVGCTPVSTDKKAKPQETLQTNSFQNQVPINSGLPESLESKQFFTPVTIPDIDTVSALVLEKADKKFAELFQQKTSPSTGTTRIVPEQYNTIQSAIDDSVAGDIIIVSPGIYYEQLSIKKGIRLLSATSDSDILEAVDNTYLKLPKRSLQTILDGSKSHASPRGILNFEEGAQRDTIVDGFTIQNLPPQNHHIPGHAHAVNLRGSSPVIMNCLVQNNGSTGIGSHVIYHDQGNAMEERDFRKANIKSISSGILYRNIVRNNLGRGIGCNHFSTPAILGNEVYNNDESSLGETPGPGIGIKHGSAPLVVGNIVHSNPGGGVLIKSGDSQGTYPVDRNSTATVLNNLIFENGTNRPALSGQSCGSIKTPVEFVENYVFKFGGIGIGLGKHSYGLINNNFVANGTFVAIAVNGSTARQVNGNIVANMKNSAFTFVNRAIVQELTENRVFGVTSTPFMIQGSTIEE